LDSLAGFCRGNEPAFISSPHSLFKDCRRGSILFSEDIDRIAEVKFLRFSHETTISRIKTGNKHNFNACLNSCHSCSFVADFLSAYISEISGCLFLIRVDSREFSAKSCFKARVTGCCQPGSPTRAFSLFDGEHPTKGKLMASVSYRFAPGLSPEGAAV
jgi:hypothetical protein